MDANTQKALESLRRRKVNSSIAIAADLANDNLNSICRLALAWISDGNVHGISYFIKPREGPVQAHNLTEAMLADSKPFDVVWDEDIAFLLKDAVLSAYRSERLFPAIKASYEASGRELPLKDVYIRDLKFLASTYMPNLANDSLTSILHRMKIPVDMDNALSRAMACICGLNWLENLYPISSYGIPLSAILAGALQGQPEEVVETREEREAREEKEAKYAKLTYYTKMLFLPFVHHHLLRPPLWRSRTDQCQLLPLFSQRRPGTERRGKRSAAGKESPALEQRPLPHDARDLRHPRRDDHSHLPQSQPRPRHGNNPLPRPVRQDTGLCQADAHPDYR